jgi:hypothetical protein
MAAISGFFGMPPCPAADHDDAVLGALLLRDEGLHERALPAVDHRARLHVNESERLPSTTPTPMVCCSGVPR